MTILESWIKETQQYRDRVGKKFLSPLDFKLNPRLLDSFCLVSTIEKKCIDKKSFIYLSSFCAICAKYGVLNNYRETKSETALFVKLGNLPDECLNILRDFYDNPGKASINRRNKTLRLGIINSFIKPLHSTMKQHGFRLTMRWWKSPDHSYIRRFLERYGKKAGLSGVESILSNVFDPIIHGHAPDLNTLEEYWEGDSQTVLHARRKRNKALVQAFIKSKEKEGYYKCEQCGVSLNCTQENRSIFEVAHKNGLSHGERKSSSNDLALLCRNCHGIYTYHEQQGKTFEEQRAASCQSQWCKMASNLEIEDDR